MEVARNDGDPRLLPPASAPIGLSTGSVYPEPTAAAFRRAAELGYDGVEVFVWTDAVSQSADELDRLVQTYQMPVLSVHSPCVIMTARVWGTDPLVKLGRSIDLAESLGASVVVTHPPFVWQRVAADNFGPAIAQMQSNTDVKIAVENMFPTSMGGQRASVYRPHWDPTIAAGHAWYTLDLSHTATAQVDARQLLAQMGRRLAHLHLADGTGSALDEHLVPGRGGQPCAEVLETLAAHRFPGSIVVEIGTRRESPANRELMLAEALGFARLHFAAPAKS
jgi:sugar phosphate isomerase/epimerase